MPRPFLKEELIEEFIADARKIVQAGEEALQALAQHDAQTACNAIAPAHYPIGRVRGHYDHILEQFALDGITPGLK